MVDRVIQPRVNTPNVNYGQNVLDTIQRLVDRKMIMQQQVATAAKKAIPGAYPENLAPVDPSKPSQPTKTTTLMPKDEEDAFKWLVSHESGGRTTAKNPTSSAFGLGQLIKSNRKHIASQLGIKNPDTTDYNEQKAMMDYYVKGRYGSYSKAVQFWQSHRWY